MGTQRNQRQVSEPTLRHGKDYGVQRTFVSIIRMLSDNFDLSRCYILWKRECNSAPRSYMNCVGIWISKAQQLRSRGIWGCVFSEYPFWAWIERKPRGRKTTFFPGFLFRDIPICLLALLRPCASVCSYLACFETPRPQVRRDSRLPS